MTGRVVCTTCLTHRPSTLARCPSCGSAAATPVLPTAGDRSAIEQDVLEAAMAVDRVLLAGVALTFGHPLGLRLHALCRDLALVRLGVLNR